MKKLNLFWMVGILTVAASSPHAFAQQTANQCIAAAFSFNNQVYTAGYYKVVYNSRSTYSYTYLGKCPGTVSAANKAKVVVQSTRTPASTSNSNSSQGDQTTNSNPPTTTSPSTNKSQVQTTANGNGTQSVSCAGLSEGDCTDSSYTGGKCTYNYTSKSCGDTPASGTTPVAATSTTAAQKNAANGTTDVTASTAPNCASTAGNLSACQSMSGCSLVGGLCLPTLAPSKDDAIAPPVAAAPAYCKDNAGNITKNTGASCASGSSPYTPTSTAEKKILDNAKAPTVAQNSTPDDQTNNDAALQKSMDDAVTAKSKQADQYRDYASNENKIVADKSQQIKDLKSATKNPDGTYQLPSGYTVDSSGNVVKGGSGSTTATKDQLKTAISDAKDDKSDAKKAASTDLKSASSTDKEAQRMNRVSTSDVNSIQVKDDAKTGGCGHYGGANCDTTNYVNMGVTAADTIGSAVGGMAVSKTSSNAQNAVAAKGISATQDDINQAANKTADATLKAARVMLITDSVGALAQAQRLVQHQSSLSKINTTANEARGLVAKNAALINKNALPETEGTQTVTDKNGRQSKAIQQKTPQQMILDNIKENAATETANQQTMVKGQAQALIATSQNIQKQVQAIAAANAIKNAAAANKSAFAFNPGTQTGDMGTGAVDGTAPVAGAVVDSALDDGTLKDANQLDPTLADNGSPGSGTGAFQNAAPAAGGPAAGGGGVGAAPGTQAAKDDTAKNDNGPQSKGQGGGAYANGDGPVGSGYSRGGGNNGPSVGVDNSFADLLRKLLPGGEDDKKAAGDVAFDDRSPASDKAAVMDRSKDIFKEIHKRYQQKSNDGAIVFEG